MVQYTTLKKPFSCENKKKLKVFNAKVFADWDSSGPDYAVPMPAQKLGTVLAHIGKTMVGSCNLHTNDGIHFELWNLGVEEAHRRRGIARTMCVTALVWARELVVDVNHRCMANIQLWTKVGSEAASLYLSLGFKTVSLKNGIVHMVKNLFDECADRKDSQI